MRHFDVVQLMAHLQFQYIGKSSRDAGLVRKRKEKWDLVLTEFNRGRVTDKWDLKRLKALRNREITKKKKEVAINHLYTFFDLYRLTPVSLATNTYWQVGMYHPKPIPNPHPIG